MFLIASLVVIAQSAADGIDRFAQFESQAAVMKTETARTVRNLTDIAERITQIYSGEPGHTEEWKNAMLLRSEVLKRPEVLSEAHDQALLSFGRAEALRTQFCLSEKAVMSKSLSREQIESVEKGCEALEELLRSRERFDDLEIFSQFALIQARLTYLIMWITVTPDLERIRLSLNDRAVRINHQVNSFVSLLENAMIAPDFRDRLLGSARYASLRLSNALKNLPPDSTKPGELQTHTTVLSSLDKK